MFSTLFLNIVVTFINNQRISNYITIKNMFEFAKYTEITDLAFKLNPDYQTSGYIRIFICPDVNDYHLVRVLKGFNEEYEKDENSFLLERNKIEKDRKQDKLTLSKVRSILINDEFDNWDIFQFDSLKDAINELDGGFGILNLKEEN